MSAFIRKITQFFMMAVLLCMATGAAHAGAFKVLHRFSGTGDGALPFAGLTVDAAGNFYGTTFEGGDESCGCGTVFALTAQGGLKVLHAFQGANGNDGENPEAAPVIDKQGNLYATTVYGGPYNAGTILELARRNHAETILYAFTGGDDGAYPQAPVLIDAQGDLFGEAESGNDARNDVNGNVFRLSPRGSFKVLHSFCCAQNDGVFPVQGLIADSSGNLYGATSGGGSCQCYAGGTVFRVSPGNRESILYSFCSLGNCADGEAPNAPLVRDQAGNLYGTTYWGGSGNCTNGCGVLFKIAPDGTETVLHAFGSAGDGANPSAGLIVDAAGNLYGTTVAGGKSGGGTVFEWQIDATEKVLHAFCEDANCADGQGPVAPLVLTASGDLYGTTGFGGKGTCTWSIYTGCGTIFRLAAK